MQTLSWTEVSSRARDFASKWANETSESSGKQSFWNDFFEVFGRNRRTVAAFEVAVQSIRGTKNFIDLLWRGVLLVEHKSRGKNLSIAESQAFEYVQDLAREQRFDEIPRYIIVSDFARIALYDLEPLVVDELPLFAGRPYSVCTFPVTELHKNVRLFAFLNGSTAVRADPEDPANERAYALMCEVHDALEDAGFRGSDLEKLLVRILFCLFADDTGVFEPSAFESFLRDQTREDGSDVGARLNELFEVLNTPEDRWPQGVRESFFGFRYINGDLFGGRLGFPQFSRSTRRALLDACAFQWARVSPAVFGSLFQGVLDDRARRQSGAHYTSEADILKVVRSQFIDDLKLRLASAQRETRKAQRTARLKQLHLDLRAMRFLDPACGCGNFLVVAYRELRQLELELLRQLNAEQQFLDIRHAVLVDVDQFYGLEISEWPSRIASVAMWLMDHQMNLQVSDLFGASFERLPLQHSANITQANALRIDWSTVLTPSSTVRVLGNPPFVGKKEQSDEQKSDMAFVWDGVQGTGVLDYVTAWYKKAAAYIEGTDARVAFVSTNSITQGEQVGILWDHLFQRYRVKIHFAHRTFPWRSEARGAAHVHVVIIGFGQQRLTPCRLFEYDGGSQYAIATDVQNISPYLIAAGDFTVRSRKSPISDVPPMAYGSMMIDKDRSAGGDAGLILDATNRASLLRDTPALAPFIRPLLGGEEFLNGGERWCLWLVDAPAGLLRGNPALARRLEGIREYRESSSRAQTRALAAVPYLFGEIRQPTSRYLFVPKVSSERRRYLPIGFAEPSTIASGSGLVVDGATELHFGVLSSAMHNVWLRCVAGRMKSDLQYSANIVYNNVPWPVRMSDGAVGRVIDCARSVLEIRSRLARPVGDSTLADLYDSLTMPRELVAAHAALDRAVDSCYRKEPFKSDRDRLEHLFELYHQITAPLTQTRAKKRRKSRRPEVVKLADISGEPADEDSGESGGDGLPDWFRDLVGPPAVLAGRGEARGSATDLSFAFVSDLIETKQFKECNDLLSRITESGSSFTLEIAIVLLTATADAAAHLPARQHLLASARQRIAATGRDADSILRGL
jgi:hypothetical protein